MTAGAVIYTTDLDRLAAFYIAALDFRARECKPDYTVLEAHAFQLVLLRADGAMPRSTDVNAGPSSRRSEAAIKLVFRVPSIEAARTAASGVGGRVNGVQHEWRFGAHRVCDGLDPDGNVIQLREEWRPAPSPATE